MLIPLQKVFFFEKLISVSDRKQYRFLFERKLGSHRVVVSRPTDIFLRNNCWGAITWGKSYFARLRSLFMGLDKRQRMTSDIECFRYCVLRIKAKLVFLGKATNWVMCSLFWAFADTNNVITERIFWWDNLPCLPLNKQIPHTLNHMYNSALTSSAKDSHKLSVPVALWIGVFPAY